MHPLVVVTAAACDPPAVITLCAVGAMLKLHVPAWVTVTACPAIVSVPVRGLVEVFAATVYATVPFPVPLPPLVTVIQDALLPPVQVQPVVVVTAVVNDPPAAATFCAFGAIAKLQVAAALRDGERLPGDRQRPGARDWSRCSLPRCRPPCRSPFHFRHSSP